MGSSITSSFSGYKGKALVMEAEVHGGDLYADYDYIYGDNATDFIVNFTEMEEICPDMTDDDRALLQGTETDT